MLASCARRTDVRHARGSRPMRGMNRVVGNAVRWRRAALPAALAPLATLALVGVCEAVPIQLRPVAAPASGKLPGLVSGLLLLALLIYSFYLYAAPLLRDRDSGLGRVAALLLAIAAVKFVLLPFFGGYPNDISSYESWALQMAAQGPARIYRSGYFLDYPPGYLYALWLMGIVASAVHAGGAALKLIVQAPAMIFDFALAALVFVLMRRTAPARPAAARVALLLVALNPALLYDTVVWGQTDSVMAAILLLSAALALDDEFELAWALAAFGVLVKPQALMFVPVLGWWTMLRAPQWQWWRAAFAALVTAMVGVLPFQLGHPWYWIFDLYHSTAAYYHETSVNAFNLIALLGGLRKPDSDTILGVPYFALGMSLLAPLYAFVGWRLWRERTARGLLYASFAALFGFFMLAPRMHERYLYAALVFAAPLAVESAEMAVVFAILTASCLFNLAYVLHALKTVIFLDSRDPLAMAASAINVVALVLTADFGLAGYAFASGTDAATKVAAAESATCHASAGGPIWRWTAARLARITPMAASAVGEGVAAQAPVVERKRERLAAIPWLRADTLIIAALIAVAAGTRLWHLGHPAEIVFDEVHFVAQARHYIRSEPFLDPHPPLAKLVIAAGIVLFGDHPWSWRIGNAVLGILLVALTYMLGRRMFASRLAAALAGAFVTCDGMFLVDSRIAVIDIVYLTFAAWSYLLLFRFAESERESDRRRTLAAMAVTLGLCVGSKLYVPAVTFLLCVGFMVYFILRREPAAPPSQRYRRLCGAVLMVGALSAICYVAVFLPHYILGWWGGIADLFRYYKDVMWYERSVASATHPYRSPWWSWPLMLRPIAYWQNFPPHGKVATIWGGGNPLLWWAALTAITITAVRALERPSPARAFPVIGYLAYLVIWMPVFTEGRTLFLYHYMPSVYMGYLALAAIVADAWRGEAEMWECAALVLTMLPAAILGLGGWRGQVAGAALVMFAGYLVAAELLAGAERPRWAPRLVAAGFLAAAAALFIYYFPVWTAIPIDRAGYYARMWLQGPGLRNWI